MSSFVYKERSIKFLVSCIFLLSNSLYGYYSFEKIEACSAEECFRVEAGSDLYYEYGVKTNKVTYQILIPDLSDHACFLENDCWLFLGEVSDKFRIQFNNKLIQKSDYFSDFESQKVFLPKRLIKKSNVIKVEVIDLNQTRFGLRSSDIGIGTFSEVHLKSSTDWFIRTGSTLLSAFSLFVIFVGLFTVFIISRDIQVMLVLILSIVSSVYMMSFSSIPRMFMDPVYLSGPFHFLSRILVDYMIVVIAYKLYQPNYKDFFFLRLVPFLYLFAVVMIFGGYLLSIRNYNFYQNVMLLFAPLVLTGGGLLFFLSFSFFDRTEARVVTPVFFILLTFQCYDLMVFWQIVRGAFTVKFYLPFLLVTLTWICIRRKMIERDQFKVDAVLGDKLRKISHDILSPISRMKDLVSRENFNKDLLMRNLVELDFVSYSLLNRSEVRGDIGIMTLRLILQDLVEKYRESHGINITLKLSRLFDWYQLDVSVAYRIFQNLINNSIKAGADELEIVGFYVEKKVIINVKDNGSGVEESLIPYIFKGGVSSCKSSTGLGLSYVKKELEKYEGTITLIPTDKGGSCFQLELLLTEIILVDDNPLTGDTWEYLSKSIGLKYQFFNTLGVETLTFNSSRAIFIDYNLGNSKGDEIARKLICNGFRNVTIATGENSLDLKDLIVISKEFPFSV